MSKIILTGDRPTGRLHVGHYVGSLAERVKLQNSGLYDEIYIMIADAQALTDNAEHPEKVRQNIIQVALDYLACGIDPDKSTIFIQSMVPELTEQLPASLAVSAVKNVRRTVRPRRSQLPISVHTLIMISVQAAVNVRKFAQDM